MTAQEQIVLRAGNEAYANARRLGYSAKQAVIEALRVSGEVAKLCQSCVR